MLKPAPKPKKTALLARVHREVQVMGAQAVLYHVTMAELLGLNVTDLRCLAIARFGPPVTAGRIAEMTGLTTGAITGVIDRLDRAGLVRRKQDPNDRRRVLVEPVGARTEELKKLFRPLGTSMEALWVRYNEKELATFSDFFVKSGAIFRDATAKLTARATPTRRARR